MENGIDFWKKSCFLWKNGLFYGKNGLFGLLLKGNDYKTDFSKKREKSMVSFFHFF